MSIIRESKRKRVFLSPLLVLLPSEENLRETQIHLRENWMKRMQERINLNGVYFLSNIFEAYNKSNACDLIKSIHLLYNLELHMFTPLITRIIVQ